MYVVSDDNMQKEQLSKKIKANPGGLLSPGEVFGRNRLIQDLWDRLESQSVILSAERRMGKTSVIRKMQAEPLDAQIVFFRDLESVRSPLELADVILQDVKPYLSQRNKTAKVVRSLIKKLGGFEFDLLGFGVKLPESLAPHWKDILNSTIADLVEYKRQERIIFFWDEVPWMLQAIAQNNTQDAATEVLDTLRAIRQTFTTVRMVFTGSIGLHHVIDRFREAGYGNASTNDMYVVDLPPLDPEQAANLASELLKGENIQLSDSTSLSEVAQAIAQEVDCIPYYIHHVVAQLKTLRQPVDIETVQSIVKQALVDPQDQWKLYHYQERLTTYYKDPEDPNLYPYTLAILDELAALPEGLLFSDLINRLNVPLGLNSDRELVRRALNLLKKDYYLLQKESQYQFRYSLIQRYWKQARL